MSKQREKGSCRDCNLSINLNYLRCLQYDGMSQDQIAKIYGVTQGTISFIKRGVTWKNV